MMTLRRSCMLLVAATVAFACSDAGPPDQGMTVKEIVQNNLEAVRGEAAGNTESMDAVLRILEADYTLVARYRASSDGFMRIDLFDGDTRVYSEGKDAMGVWEWPGGKQAPENVHHDGVGALEHGIEFNLFSLAELPGRGHEIELLGNETIEGAQYFVLKITLSDGFETYRYVSAETWLVELSRDFRAFHPALDDTKKHIETRYDRWERTDGVLFAGRSQNVDLSTGEVIATTLVLQSRFNVVPETLDMARGYVPMGAPRLSEQDNR